MKGTVFAQLGTRVSEGAITPFAMAVIPIAWLPNRSAREWWRHPSIRSHDHPAHRPRHLPPALAACPRQDRDFEPTGRRPLRRNWRPRSTTCRGSPAAPSAGSGLGHRDPASRTAPGATPCCTRSAPTRRTACIAAMRINAAPCRCFWTPRNGPSGVTWRSRWPVACRTVSSARCTSPSSNRSMIVNPRRRRFWRFNACR